MEDFTEHHLKVQRTARYFTYGTLTNQTEQVWFALHGYAMLAKQLIKRFKVLDPEKHFVIAPEGLSRFYWGGFSSKPVASWMTSEDRLNEIDDYIAYLDQLYQATTQNINPNTAINALGFSQGTATCARWLAAKNSKVDNMIFWAGPLPHDVDWDKALPIFNQSNVLFVLGDKDEFITQAHQQDHDEKLQKLGLKYKNYTFDGKHEVNEELLLKIANSL